HNQEGLLVAMMAIRRAESKLCDSLPGQSSTSACRVPVDAVNLEDPLNPDPKNR
ncbi:MAG: hypothetical protein ACI84D_003531, partial [Thalassolituus oleivorans]